MNAFAFQGYAFIFTAQFDVHAYAHTITMKRQIMIHNTNFSHFMFATNKAFPFQRWFLPLWIEYRGNFQVPTMMIGLRPHKIQKAEEARSWDNAAREKLRAAHTWRTDHPGHPMSSRIHKGRGKNISNSLADSMWENATTRFLRDMWTIGEWRVTKANFWQTKTYAREEN